MLIRGENVKEKLELVKRGLIIVDMIDGFVKEGALADPSIGKIVDENVRLAKKFLESKDPIIAFRDVHSVDSEEFKSFPPHCIKGTSEVEFVEGLKELSNKFIIIDKNSTSGMFAPSFIEYVKSMENITEIVITGCCTDICILNLAIPLKNFFNQVNKSVNIIVPKNAVETYHIENIHDRDEYNGMAFKLLKQAGVSVVKEYNYGK
jgi:nicotinamidase-related amidase